MDKDRSYQQPLQFRVLSDGQIDKLYEATLECLNRTGVDVLNAQARDLLAAAGARVAGKRVRIPPYIIRESVAATPRSFCLWGRGGDSPLQIGYSQPGDKEPNQVYFGPGPTCTCFVDPETGERRTGRRGDPGLAALVCDALDNIDYVMGLALIDDVRPDLAPVYEFAEMVANTGKPVLAWAYTPKNVADIYQIALAVAGSEQALRRCPCCALFSTFQAPLVQTEQDMVNVLWAVQHDLPVVLLGGATAGMSGPVTGAGSLVISLAGALSGLAILQLQRPGAAVCLGSVPEAMDLRTCLPAYGGPEMSLYSAAISDVFRHLGLPFMGTAGASEAKVLDQQAAIESTMQVILSGLSGAPLVHDVGFLDCANAGSLESLIMNDEIIAMARRILRGVEVSDETLMLDVIDRVGPGGEFVSAVETARRCRAEIWVPKLLDRQAWVLWQEEGGPTMKDRIRARLKDILATHRPPPLPDGARERIESILAAAERRAPA